MAKSAISGQFPRLVLTPLMQRQNGTGTIQSGTGTIQSGTGTTHQNMIGTGTNHSGTSTDTVPMQYRCKTTLQKEVGTSTNASNSLDIGILTLLSSNSHTEGIGTLIND